MPNQVAHPQMTTAHPCTVAFSWMMSTSTEPMVSKFAGIPRNPIRETPSSYGSIPGSRNAYSFMATLLFITARRRLYQMYYMAQRHSSHWPNVRVGGVKKVGFVTLPAYVESTDGIHWERPVRKDVSFENFAE